MDYTHNVIMVLHGLLMQKLEKSSENIKKAFQNQQARAIVSEVPPLVFACNSRFLTGAIGPGEVRADTYGMGHRV